MGNFLCNADVYMKRIYLNQVKGLNMEFEPGAKSGDKGLQALITWYSWSGVIHGWIVEN